MLLPLFLLLRKLSLVGENQEVVVSPLSVGFFLTLQNGVDPLSDAGLKSIRATLGYLRGELQDSLFLMEDRQGVRLTSAGVRLAEFQARDPISPWMDQPEPNDLSFQIFYKKIRNPDRISSKILAISWYFQEGRHVRTPSDLERATQRVLGLAGRTGAQKEFDVGFGLKPAPPKSIPAPDGVNLTSRWLKEHWEAVKPVMLRKIRSKCKTSHRAGQVEDHLQEFVRKVIHRDAFRSRIETGRPLPYSQVAVYATRSACNDIRDTGADPVCRELMGSRTEREVREGSGPDRDPIRLRQGYRSRAVKLQEGSCTDLIDQTTQVGSSVVDETVLFTQIWGRIEKMIRKRFQPEEFDLVSNFLRERYQGSSILETAQNLQIDPDRAHQVSRQIKSRLGIPVRSLLDGA